MTNESPTILIVYVVMIECNDSYYDGHIYREVGAFRTEEAAAKKVIELNGDNEDYAPFYYQKVEVR